MYQWGTPGVLCSSKPMWQTAQGQLSVMEDLNMGRTAPPLERGDPRHPQ